MNDFKSKLPDLNELTSMTTKLFNGLKKTVNEIVHDYKEKRAEDEIKKQSSEVVTDAATKAAAEQAAAAQASTTVQPKPTVRPKPVVTPTEIPTEAPPTITPKPDSTPKID